MRCKVLGTANAPSTGTVQFISPQSSTANWSTTENQFVAIPVAGIITALRVRFAAAPGAGRSRTITLRKNSVDVMSVTISDSDTTGLSTVRIAVVPGDLLSLMSTPTGTPAAGIVTWCMDFQGSSPQQAVFLTASTLGGSGVGYVPLMSNQIFGASAPANEVVISEPGTISNLYVHLSTPLGSGTRTFTLRKNGVNQSLAVGFTVGQQALTDGVNSVSVVAGDQLVLVTGGSAVAFPWVAVGFVFTPSNGDGFSSITCGCSNSPSNSVANYQPISGAAGAWDATEANQQHVMNACTFKRLQIRLSTAPGLGNTWQFNVKVNGGYVGMEVVITGTATTGSIDIDVPIANGDVVALESVPTSTPTGTGRFEWSVTTFQLNPAAGRSFAVMMG
jgi:hypothetical protein